MPNSESMDAVALAAAVRSRQVRAEEVAIATLDRIATHNPPLNAFTTVLPEVALDSARQVDEAIAQGHDPGPLAGVPFAVKDLFDIAGVTTLAGSKIYAENPPAQQDAAAVAALKQAGAVLVGALNMDEYAYGFVTENAHYGATRNPHDLTRVAGGSSGGSAAAVAGGLVPFTLGSDTSGSIRIPAALCGIFGLRPTYGRLSRRGVVPFSSSFDHIGPLARSVRDIATVFDALQGPDPADPVCTNRPPEPCLPGLDRGVEGVRMAIARGYFTQVAEPEVLMAVDQVAKALSVSRELTIPEIHRARSATFVIAAAEGSAFHLPMLRTRAQDYDPATRDRFLAGALIPTPWYVQAQRFRAWFKETVIRPLFQDVDLIIAPTAPCMAPRIGQTTMEVGGESILVRPNLGLFTQPLSFVGLPVLSVPVHLPGLLPIGVQLIAAPYRERLLLQTAAVLEAQGWVKAPLPGHVGLSAVQWT